MPSPRAQAFLRTLRADPGLRADFAADAEAVMAEYALDDADRRWLCENPGEAASAEVPALIAEPGF
ncbi:hypothetical protein V4F39_11055 [Aquincola sp. MAHUQ-54]|uniref:Uncharacterized protein n=1 Tax=Aquincola agrisoli TaxID=3119538 RepID=A0AAW9QGD6_9BURK